MSERVPRRLKRFYRDKDKQAAMDREEFGDYEDTSFRGKNDVTEEEIVTHIPDMSYEDIDNKNLKDINKIEKQNLEQKIATLEVKKFKKENKRLPNRHESEQLAGSLFKQFQENPVDDNGEFSYEGNGDEEISDRRGRHRNRRAQKDASEEKEHRHGRRGRKQKEEIASPDNDVSSTQAQGNIKDLMGGDDSGANSKEKAGSEFDLGLADDMSEDVGSVESDLGELEELADFDGKKKKKK